MANLERTGDCYETNAKHFLRMNDDNAMLVHGRVRHGIQRDITYGHCWIETTVQFDGGHRMDVCIDKSNGNDVMLPTDAYYRIGSITKTYKYNRTDAVLALTKCGHYGPFEQELEQVKPWRK